MLSQFPRIIPTLLLKNKGLYKGVRFKNHRYIGDPLNTLKLFNDKEADELLIFDIEAGLKGNQIDYEILQNIASECFMPLGYGGGIKEIKSIEKILKFGFEKVYVNSEAFLNKNFIKESIKEFGSSTICSCIDYKKIFFGKRKVFISSGKINTKADPYEWARELESYGIGEIIINSIDMEGTLGGYDFEYFQSKFQSFSVPLIISGGCNGIKDIEYAISKNINNMAGGACFVFKGIHKAVLISYPKIY